MPDLVAFLFTPRRAPFPSHAFPPFFVRPTPAPAGEREAHDTRAAGAAVQLQSMAAAAPVAPGSGRVSRLRPRPARVGLRGAVAVAVAQGPSCLYVGPIETASQEKLEALYHQVRYHFVITIIMLRLITLSFRLSDSRGGRRFFSPFVITTSSPTCQLFLCNWIALTCRDRQNCAGQRFLLQRSAIDRR